MKTEFFRNALNLSAEELEEVAKIKGQICRILEKDFNAESLKEAVKKILI